MTVGEKIKNARIAKRLTQEKLGVLLGVEKSAIAKYENGRIVNIKQATLKKISKVLEIPISELIIADENEDMDNELSTDTSVISSRSVFAENLRFHMKRSGQNQKDIAEIIGVSESTINDWFHARKYPRIEKLEKLANYFGITVPELVGEKVTTQKKTATEIGREEILDILIRLHTDNEFLEIVEKMSSLDSEQLTAFKQVLNAFSK